MPIPLINGSMFSLNYLINIYHTFY